MEGERGGEIDRYREGGEGERITSHGLEIETTTVRSPEVIYLSSVWGTLLPLT